MNQVRSLTRIPSIREVSSSSSIQSPKPSVSSSVSPEKEQFVNDLKMWATYDKQIKLLSEKTKDLRNQKSELGNRIVEFMQEKKIQDKPIELTDGQIKYVERKEYSPLTFTYIEDCLHKILADKDHVEFVIQYLRDNRKTSSVAELKRIYTSQSELADIQGQNK